MSPGQILVFKEIKSRTWTAWDTTKRFHLFRSSSLVLSDCSFVVNEDKRARVLKTKKRFPHAWVVGKKVKEPAAVRWREIHYNPFTMTQFHYKRSGRPILKARFCLFCPDGRVFVA